MASSLVNLLLMEVAAIVSIVLLAILVVLISYRRRSGHPALRLFVWAASTLFLPLVSYAVSAAAKWDAARVPLLLAWTVFLQILRNTIDTARSTTSTISSSGSNGSKFRPSVEQLARMGWVAFLIISSGGNAGSPQLTAVLLWLWVLSLLKLIHRLVAAELAKNSFAVGLNAYLVADYMKQLHGQEHHQHQEGDGGQGDDGQVPPYFVMGEEKLHIEARPQGYRIDRTSPPPSLSMDDRHVVTVERIWRLSSSGDPLLASCPQLKDLCLSFALFKLQLRRFAGCPLAEAGCHRAMAFVQNGLLGGSPERVFRVLETELSFLTDLLYSKLTVFYASGWWFPVLNTILVLAMWISCLAAGGAIVHDMCNPGTALAVDYQNLRNYLQDHDTVFHAIVGLDILVSVSFILAIVFTEGWEIANYVCSDWIKVSTICEYARRPSWRKSPWVRHKLGRVLRLRAMQQWDNRFCQMSILQLRFCYCGCVSRQVDRIAKTTVVVPAVVKSAIVETLRTNQGRLRNGEMSLQRNGVADKLLWACRICDGDDNAEASISEQILVWHVATRLVELKRSDGAHGKLDNEDGTDGESDEQVVVATRLSRYCAYLVALKPGLLPDHRAWTEELYEGVVEEVTRVLARCAGPVVRYERAVTCLGGSMNATLRKASKLGRQLVEEVGDEELTWKVLAEFWAELMIYVAPSENVTSHAKSLRRGGEFITVLWALLGHAGIVGRPESSDIRV
ncbi:hypothetical protein BS78_10G163200 [Paspalum vaginatum]|nr:hypothetical protein BS78_10G163200 [Paspalum vaginatum]